MSAALDEHTQFVDNGGKPVVNGFLYFGEQGTDPEANPITIYSDRDLSVTLPNPIRTDANGRSTSKVWVDGAYSFKLEDVNNVQLYEEQDNGASTSVFTNITKEIVNDYNLQISDNGALILIDAEANSVTVTLLPAVEAGGEFEVSFKRINGTANTVTIEGNGAQLIDGAATLDIPLQDQAYTIRCTGTAATSSWNIKGDHLVSPFETPVAISEGGTGATNVIDARANLEVSSLTVAKDDTDSPIAIANVTADRGTLYLLDATNGDIDVTLFDATTLGTDTEFLISFLRVDDSANIITITPDGVQTINGAATLTLDRPFDAFTLHSDSL